LILVQVIHFYKLIISRKVLCIDIAYDISYIAIS